MQMVTTIFGDLPESDLRFEEKSIDAGNTVQISREWFYIGSDPEIVRQVSELPGKREDQSSYVRRDAWVTFKRGLAAQPVQG